MPKFAKTGNKELSTNQSYNEHELLLYLAAGNKKAFEHIYTAYFGQLSYYAFKIVADPEQARDIVSNVLIKIATQQKSFKSIPHLKNYLYLATRHACLRFQSEQQKEQLSYNELQLLAEDMDASAHTDQVRADVIEAIYLQIQSLPKGCGEVFKLLYFEGKTTEEAAQILSITPKTVLNQKQTAIKLLKSALLKKGLLAVFLVMFAEN